MNPLKLYLAVLAMVCCGCSVKKMQRVENHLELACDCVRLEKDGQECTITSPTQEVFAEVLITPLKRKYAFNDYVGNRLYLERAFGDGMVVNSSGSHQFLHGAFLANDSLYFSVIMPQTENLVLSGHIVHTLTNDTLSFSAADDFTRLYAMARGTGEVGPIHYDLEILNRDLEQSFRLHESLLPRVD